MCILYTFFRNWCAQLIKMIYRLVDISQMQLPLDAIV